MACQMLNPLDLFLHTEDNILRSGQSLPQVWVYVYAWIPTSRSPLSGLLPDSNTLPLLQLSAEVTGTHLLGGILGKLPEGITQGDSTLSLTRGTCSQLLVQDLATRAKTDAKMPQG